jgi:hypothetical protein
MKLTRLAPLVAVSALVAGAVVVGSVASAQAPAARTLTFKELEKGSTFVHIRNTMTRSERANLQGDQIVFTNPLADASGQVVGKLHVECVTTKGSRDFMRSLMACSGVAVLRDGTMTLQAPVSPADGTTTGAVTGGTGAYANARGVLVSEEGRGGATTTITLAP